MDTTQYDQGFQTSRSVLNTCNDELNFPSDFWFAGFSFIAHKDVFSPAVMKGHDGFALNLPVVSSHSDVLEIGSGTGCVIVAHYLRNKKDIRSITAVDISPHAINNTRINFEKYGITGDVLLSNLFEKIESGSKFDVIFFNIPFFCVPAGERLSMLEKSIADPQYRSAERFFAESHGYLKKDGKILIGFSTECGSLSFLQNIASKYGRHLELFWSDAGDSIYGRDMVFQLFELK